MGNYGIRLYEHERDEHAVCLLCWKNALPGGRPFHLLPEAAALSFGRIVTGPFVRYASEYFYVVDDLATGELVGYLSGAEGSTVDTAAGDIPWMELRDKSAHRIAEDEFGDISPKLGTPADQFREGARFLYTFALGPRAVQFLAHVKLNDEREMPDLPTCPEFHFQVETHHRGQGIGGKLLEHFASRFSGRKYKKIGAQVTVCDGQVPLAYYERMSVEGEPLWSIYDRRVSTIYTEDEKEAWGLGDLVENVSLVADRDRLLAFVRQGR
jgi:GNAT superfamily N-acetyltransferase